MIKGGCQSGRKVVPHNSKTDLCLANIIIYFECIFSKLFLHKIVACMMHSIICLKLIEFSTSMSLKVVLFIFLTSFPGSQGEKIGCRKIISRECFG